MDRNTLISSRAGAPSQSHEEPSAGRRHDTGRFRFFDGLSAPVRIFDDQPTSADADKLRPLGLAYAGNHEVFWMSIQGNRLRIDGADV